MAVASPDQIRALLRKWVLDEGPRRDADALTDACDLLQDGWIDSLGLMGLISYVEDLLERALDESEMRMENFTSIDRIVHALFNPAPKASAAAAAR